MKGAMAYLRKEVTMKSHQTRLVMKLCVGAVAVLLVAGLSTVCKGKKAETPEPAKMEAQAGAAEAPDQVASLRTILGEAKEDYPGVQDIEQEGGEFIVYYRFIPKDTNTLREELGEDLAPKIRRIYETDKAVDVLRFDVSIPFTEEAGVTNFKHQLSFTMTRKIFNETDWSGLLNRDFLKVVLDLKAEE
jgi:uncharacterized membrane protein